MYLSRVSLNPEAGRNPAYWQAVKPGYGLHQLIWSLFADRPDRKRDFLYHQAKGRIYTVSARRPKDQAGVWEVETKPYQPRLLPGKRLWFNLRANPVVSKRDEKGRQTRHDVVMEAKQKVGWKGLSPNQRPALPDLIQKAGLAWLAARAQAHGFALEEGRVRADGHRRHRLRKPGAHRSIRISTLDFQGYLRVVDPDKFNQVLFNGLGPAKGFGCGLMLVKGA